VSKPRASESGRRQRLAGATRLVSWWGPRLRPPCMQMLLKGRGRQTVPAVLASWRASLLPAEVLPIALAAQSRKQLESHGGGKKTGSKSWYPRRRGSRPGGGPTTLVSVLLHDHRKVAGVPRKWFDAGSVEKVPPAPRSQASTA
jgi:hypothetical protein